jgi:uncharacterized protein (DUF1697 family)
MEQLRAVVSSLGFSDVETFIASGNVIFSGRATQARRAETQIEDALRAMLGYDVATFIRTDVELAAIAARAAFPQADVDRAAAFSVGFLKAPLPQAGVTRLMALCSDVDAFQTAEREIYWLCRVRQSDSKFSNVLFDRAVGGPATFRSITTVRKMAAKYAPPSR